MVRKVISTDDREDTLKLSLSFRGTEIFVKTNETSTDFEENGSYFRK